MSYLDHNAMTACAEAAPLDLQVTGVPDLAHAGAAVSAAQRRSKVTVHVVSADQRRRAQIARSVFSGGHHAEVYGGAEELVDHRPAHGVVLVDSVDAASIVDLLENLATNGLWLPIVRFGDDPGYDTIIALTKLGIEDFVIGDVPADVLLSKLLSAYEAGENRKHTLKRSARACSLLAGLSSREREVLEHLAEGLSNKEMARRLGISPRTVEIHRMKMMAKLDARSAADAVRLHLEASLYPARGPHALRCHGLAD